MLTYVWINTNMRCICIRAPPSGDKGRGRGAWVASLTNADDKGDGKDGMELAGWGRVLTTVMSLSAMVWLFWHWCQVVSDAYEKDSR